MRGGQRAAIVFYYLYGLTQAETAAHLGIEVSAVKTRPHKGRGALRRGLLDLWEGQQMTTPAQPSMAAMRIESVRKKQIPEETAYVIVLQEVDGPRYLLIHVGAPEGDALAISLLGTETPRPMTYAFMVNVLQAANATLREVRINKLVEDIFYATAHFESVAGPRSVDARPSDALNLAAITGAPIRVATEVLEASGITIQQQTTRDEDDREVVEQTIRHAISGDEVHRVHLNPETGALIRVLVNRDLRERVP